MPGRSEEPDKKPDDKFLKDLEKKLKKDNPGNGGPKKDGGKTSNRLALIIVLSLIVGTIFLMRQDGNDGKIKEKNYTEFLDGVESGQITELTIIRTSHTIEYTIQDQKYETRIPFEDDKLLPLLQANNVVIKSEDRQNSPFLEILINILPWILIMGVFWILISRQFRSKSGGAFSFGKSRARLVNQEDIKESFRDVQGCDEAKADLRDVITFLKDPKRFTDIGAKIPKGVILIGPPGTGKTMLAKAAAGEAKVPFFSMSGSDFVEMFVGVGASRVRDLFETGKKHAPCILFIDEIDAVGRMRGAGYGGGHDEREQTLNQMLVEMDGFDTSDAVILMAATNRPDVLDKALLRPGRFDRQIVVDYPDVIGRKGILEIHAKKIKLSQGIKLDSIARGTPGFTGADLANLINESALIAAKKGKKTVDLKDMEEAKDKVMMGSERKSIMIKDEEKKNTAYHEAGHALISLLLDQANMLHKVSIIPRGRALGLTTFLPEDGVHTMNKSKIDAELKVLFGGRIAEDIIFKDFTNGAANDIERATRLAKAMVCEWGMSRLGPIAYGEKDEPVFIGKEIARREDYSEDTAKKIDAEIQKILKDAYASAKQLIQKNISKLKTLAEALLKHETLGIEEIYDLLKMKKPKNFMNLDEPIKAIERS